MKCVFPLGVTVGDFQSRVLNLHLLRSRSRSIFFNFRLLSLKKIYDFLMSLTVY